MAHCVMVKCNAPEKCTVSHWAEMHWKTAWKICEYFTTNNDLHRANLVAYGPVIHTFWY
jgi:hypothetical protein